MQILVHLCELRQDGVISFYFARTTSWVIHDRGDRSHTSMPLPQLPQGRRRSGLLHGFNQVAAARYPRPCLIEVGNEHLEVRGVETVA
jgi:hypothetical protein